MSPETPVPHLVAWLAGDTLAAQFTGEALVLGEGAAHSLAAEFDLLTPGPGQRRVRLDFGNVRLVSSSFLGLVLRLHCRLQVAGVRLTVCNLAPEVYRVFERIKLTALLDVRRAGPWGGPPEAD